ncbi:MAG: CYTH domain-containing protein, partial [Oscillospiraceae bacterium]
MGLELEFKYALTGPDQLEQLCQALGDAFGPWEAVDMATVYYDTQDKALAARCWTLRVRQENGIPVLTMKTPGPGGARREWELPGGSLMDLPRLQALGAPPEVVALGPDQLAPQCGARFRRLRCLARLPDLEAELALDQGVLLGG